MQRTCFAFGLAAFFFASAPALANPACEQAPPPPPGTVVRGCGAVLKLTEHGCVGVCSHGIILGPLYNVTGLHPKPRPGKMIEYSGHTTDGTSYCNEGTPIVGRYKYVDVCPAAKKTE
jgi:hypothetical protein